MLAPLLLGVTLTLAQAFDQAERQNPDLLAARARLPVTEAGITTAGAWPNPTLSASYGTDEPKMLEVIDQRFPIFGQRSTAIEAARAELPVAEAQLAEQAVSIHAAVRRSYATLAVAQSHAVLAAQSAQLARDLANIARKKFDLGAAPQLDAEQAALAAKRAEQEQRSQEAARDAALPPLDAALGEPPDNLLEVSGLTVDAIQVAPLESYLAQLEHHPTIVAAQAERAAALARVARERAAIRPTPDLALQLEQLVTNNTGFGLRGTLAFDAPILSQNQGPIALARAEAEAALIVERAARIRLTAAVRSAWLRLKAALDRARFFATEQVPVSEKVEALARLSYQEGRTPLIGVLQAQADVNAARLQAIDALGDAQAALADLEEATGVGF